MPETTGRILNLYGELPHTLGVDEIGQALLEIDMEITGIAEPPVARLQSPYAAGNSPEILESEIEDYRRFYVEFEPWASNEDVVAAVKIVFSSFQRLRAQD